MYMFVYAYIYVCGLSLNNNPPQKKTQMIYRIDRLDMAHLFVHYILVLFSHQYMKIVLQLLSKYDLFKGF